MSSTQPIVAAPKKRDPRLDFFRGIGMFIIFMAHMPGNWFTLYIPARFGFSDATEIFVFCSGMASALAFGKIFSDISWLIGAVRIVHRIWQVYWAHIGLFFVVMVLMIAQNWVVESNWFCSPDSPRLCFTPGSTENWDYVGRLNVHHLFGSTDAPDAMGNFLGLMTLTWVPNLFDILPMYIVILAMIPLVMALARIHPWVAMGTVVALWLSAQLDLFELPAEPWSDREWFFNPFAWCLIFFTGFAFMMKWLPRPPFSWGLVAVSLAFIVFSIPITFWGIYNNEVFSIGLTPYVSTDGHQVNTPMMAFRVAFWELMAKTDFGILRYLHFLALAYVFWLLAGEGGRRLDFQSSLGQLLVRIVHKVGQQSLATFLAGIVLSRFFGFILDIIGSSWPNMILVNLVGMAMMVAVAYLVGWIKKSPWKQGAKGSLDTGTSNVNMRTTPQAAE